MTQQKTYVRELPEDQVVRLSVEKVYKKTEDDSTFALDCRICDGERVGDCISLYFFRYRKDGGVRVDTERLFKALFPDQDPPEVPSRMFEGKIFECKPWWPRNSKYQAYSDFKYIGNNDVF